MKLCPFCGAQLNDNAHFCLYCMTSLDEKRLWPTPHRHSKRWQVILAAVFVFVAALTSCLLILQFKTPLSFDAPTNDSTTTTDESVETSIGLFDTTTSINAEKTFLTPSETAVSSTAPDMTTTSSKRTITLPKTTTSVTSAEIDSPSTITTSATTNKAITSGKTSSTAKLTSTTSKQTSTTITSRDLKTTASSQKTTTTRKPTATTTKTVTTTSKTTQRSTTTTVISTTTQNTQNNKNLLPLPEGFIQEGDRLLQKDICAAYLEKRNIPDDPDTLPYVFPYYYDTKDLYVEIVDLSLYIQNDRYYLDYTLKVPSVTFAIDNFKLMIQYQKNNDFQEKEVLAIHVTQIAPSPTILSDGCYYSDTCQLRITEDINTLSFKLDLADCFLEFFPIK